MALKNTVYAVFTEVVNSGGWSNVGTACLVAQVTVLYCNLGSDSMVHIRKFGFSLIRSTFTDLFPAEEVGDASLNVPPAMLRSYLLTVFMGIITLITMFFFIGPLDSVLTSDTPYPLYSKTRLQRRRLVLIIALLILILMGNITALATTSRELRAFARDKGLPYSKWISKMNHKHNAPDNFVYLTSVVIGILYLVNLGSNAAFNIIISLILLALLSTHMISIGCVLRERLRGEELPPARWSLGRFGILVNAFPFLTSGFVVVFCYFPDSLPVTTGDANWAPAV